MRLWTVARVELPREERRRCLQDLVGFPQVPVFALEALDLLELFARWAGPFSRVGLRLPDPLPQHLWADIKLGREVAARGPHRRVILQTINRHTNRSLTNLMWVFLGHNRILSLERKRQEIRDGSFVRVSIEIFWSLRTCITPKHTAHYADECGKLHVLLQR